MEEINLVWILLINTIEYIQQPLSDVGADTENIKSVDMVKNLPQ